MEDAGRTDWDNRLWDHVWERNLSQVERHNTALAVLRLRPPGTPFDDLVARELARRWRRRSAVLASVYVLWTLFWGSLALLPWPEADRPALPLGCAVFGLVVIAGCLVARRRFGAYLLRGTG